MNRTTLSLIAGVAALAAVTGFATVSAPDTGTDAPAKAAAHLPVERTSLVCPPPSTSDLAETTYTSYTPPTEGTEKGKAELLPTTKKSDEKALNPAEPGKPATGTVSGADAPALIGTAEGHFAPGWTVQQTTEVAAGTGRGLQGTTCTPADTEFWFPGTSTAAERTDYVHLTNPDDSAAVVDIELYGKDGALKTTVGEGITVKPNSAESVLLSTLTGEKQTDVTVHVVVRSGRVGAAVQALDDQLGGDWLPASADPSGSLVLPGIPKDATAVRLIAFTPRDADVDLKLRLASPTGAITPAGHETLHVKGGMTAAVDLGDITRGEAGSLLLTAPDSSVPVVAAVRVLRGEGEKQESAFIPAARPIGTRATAVDNTAKGTALSVTAPEGPAEIKVTASSGTEGGTQASKTYTIKSGTTQIVEAPVPSGVKGTYALTLESESDTPVYASRTLTKTTDGVPFFTVQPLPDDRGTVAVPQANEDLSILQE
ncbi:MULTISPECIES: DUF5719 family protein [unclassified Streptomyces]|uniref:DUF5719 family protein n=1 Tax=unclassified Streptomyces TaxID=2593676 RepID=UPI000A9CD925|nr:MULTISPECIES: DUF5719 family protein [unclassified Streptomyces]AZM61880.1 hypothetical protein DLM49_22110 [Streptomyces sp. WAC 01438]RSM87758.1 hypothetical protein DMA10_34790 [Streptomyces sp. WAC 01420]